MGWFSKAWKKVKNVFKKVTKVVKKVVKSVGKAAKKVWSGVKRGVKKLSKGIKKLGPFANIAMNFIPGFGQLWSAYGIWGQLAKGAVTGFALSGGSAQGALLGAASMGAADIFKNMPGEGIAGKVGEWFKGWTDSTKIGKAFGDSISKFKDAFKPAGTKPVSQGIFDKHMATEYAPNYTAPIPPWEEMQTKMEKEAYGGPREKGWTFAEGNPPSLLNRIKDAIPDMSKIKPMDSALATAGVWNPDTSPLNSVGTSIAAGDTRGQAGFGKDADEELIRRLGLVPLLQQYQTGQQTYMT